MAVVDSSDELAGGEELNNLGAARVFPVEDKEQQHIVIDKVRGWQPFATSLVL